MQVAVFPLCSSYWSFVVCALAFGFFVGMFSFLLLLCLDIVVLLVVFFLFFVFIFNKIFHKQILQSLLFNLVSC